MLAQWASWHVRLLESCSSSESVALEREWTLEGEKERSVRRPKFGRSRAPRYKSERELQAQSSAFSPPPHRTQMELRAQMIFERGRRHLVRNVGVVKAEKGDASEQARLSVQRYRQARGRAGPSFLPLYKPEQSGSQVQSSSALVGVLTWESESWKLVVASPCRLPSCTSYRLGRTPDVRESCHCAR